MNPATTPPHDPLIGTMAGRYRLVRRLGEGGMGAVYLGEREEDFTHAAAVKLLLEGAASDETARRFQAEKEALAAFRHPNIVKLLDAGVTPGRVPYLVMDYVQGEPLDRYCAARQLDLTGRLKLIIQLLDAIGAAHRRLIVHCDLKPSNVLVTADGMVQVLDFGIAKMLDPSQFGFTSALTKTFRPLTPEFASPEQLSGEPITTATDLYAAGVLLYELLTGEHPFEDRVMQPVALLEAICFEAPERPSRRAARLKNPPVPARLHQGDLDAVVLQAIAKEPDRRYRDADAFAEDLRRWMEGRAVQAHAPTAWYRASKFARRKPAVAAAAAIAVIAALGGAAGTVENAIRADRQRARAQARVADVRRLSNALLADYYDRVSKLPGATRVQQLLVSRSVRYLDAMASESRSDPSLSLELAEGFIKLAGLQGSPYENNIGQPEEGVATARKAIAIADAAREAGGTEPQVTIVRSKARQSHAEALLAIGRVAEAVEESRAAAGLLDSVLAAGHRTAEALLQAASMHETLADQLGSTGLTGMLDRGAAVREMERALDLYGQAMAVAPESTRPRRAAVVIRMKLADLRWDADPLGSLAQYEQAQRDLERLPATELDNLPNRRLRGSLLRRRGEALGELGRLDEAADLLEKDVRVLDSVLSIDPGNERAVWDLAIAVNALGTVEVERGRRAAAAAHYRRVIELLARVPALRASTQGRLTEGDALIALGDWRGGSALLESVTDREDASSQALVRVANTLLDRDPGRALRCLERAEVQPGVSSDPSVALLKARALRKLGREREAITTATAALPLAPESAETSINVRTRLKTFLSSR